jgi:periplasmic protein TonB
MRVLLVDHDSEALETITRAIRGVLELDCVTSKGDALLLLRQNTYEVLIACERCVDGSGLDLLGRTTRTAVPLKRIFAAAPERLQLLGPRLAPFKVQRTINYPIDLEELWLAIAQVTGDPNDETDGTIERVVLDERGIPSTGSTPRIPIPPRPPAPLREVAPPPAPAVAAANVSRAATARLPQQAHAPEPAPRVAPPVPRVPPPAARAVPAAQTRRAAAPPPPVAPPPMTAAEPFPSWTPEAPASTEDDFAEIAAQARFGVQKKAVDDAARRKRQRIYAATGIAVVVAGAIVLLIEKFYDPEQRARDRAIAAQVQQMAEQQKVTDNLTLIEIDIENAIMNNDFVTARRELAQLIEKAPGHPRREFLQASIDRAEELARLSPNAKPAEKLADSAPQAPAKAAVIPSSERASRPRPAERAPVRAPERVAARTPERSTAARATRDAPPPATRSYGAPIIDTPRQPTIPLDAPINAPPTYSARRSDNAFPGRTVEASDSGLGRGTPPAPGTQPPTTSGALGSAPTSAGTAAVPMPNTAPSAAPPDPLNVVPAKIVKRISPVPPGGLSRKTSGFVIVTYNIGTNGRVSDVQILESQPQGVFDDSARDAVRKWVYEPRKENGVAVASPGKARLVFEPTN